MSCTYRYAHTKVSYSIHDVHVRFSDHPKITQYSRSPSTRSLSVKQESPDSVHDMIDVAHAYIHHAVDQMYQSPPPLMNKPENLQDTKAMHAHHTKQAPK